MDWALYFLERTVEVFLCAGRSLSPNPNVLLIAIEAAWTKHKNLIFEED